MFVFCLYRRHVVVAQRAQLELWRPFSTNQEKRIWIGQLENVKACSALWRRRSLRKENNDMIVGSVDCSTVRTWLLIDNEYYSLNEWF